jgi:hypothetical protein
LSSKRVHIVGHGNAIYRCHPTSDQLASTLVVVLDIGKPAETEVSLSNAHSGSPPSSTEKTSLERSAI